MVILDAVLDLDTLDARTTGRVATPSDPDWDLARQAFNLVVDQRPLAVAFPADEADVIEIVRYAKARGLRIAPQGTGHNAGPIASLHDTILLRTSQMRGAEIDVARRSARVKAGAQWRDVVPQASERGLAALHGSSPNVGLVGYSLGGGLGFYARKHGLQTNAITAIELVTADGELIRADHDNHAELFWALRGGGGSFGVVTALEFDLLSISEVYAGALFFPYERASEILHAWREWTATVPDELTSIGRTLRFPDLPDVPDPVRGRSFTVLELAFIGDEADGADLAAPLRALGPIMDTVAMVHPVALSDLHMDPPDPVPFFSSHVNVEGLPAEALDAVLAVSSAPDSRVLGMELRHLGGALSRSAPHHGAVDTMPGEYLMFASGLPGETPELTEVVHQQLRAAVDALAPYEAGRYLNFVEEPIDTGTVYPRETHRRLAAVKATVDPDGRFVANHPIEVD
jgi:FAD/FMN-containing dehydrogenase